MGFATVRIEEKIVKTHFLTLFSPSENLAKLKMSDGEWN